MKTNEEKKELPNKQKAAILMIALNARSPGFSQQIFSKMGESQSKELLHEINNLGKISPEEINNIIEEFYSLAITQDSLLGGKNITDKFLKDSFGIDNSDGYFTTKKGLLSFTKTISDKDLLAFLKTEKHQVVALILSLLSDERSAELLAKFPVEDTAIISKKMLSIDVPNYKYLWSFHRELETHLLGDSTEAIEESQQIFKLSRVLEMMDSSRRDVVMKTIKEQDEKSAERLEKLIFSFPDLEFMSTKDLGTIMVEVDPLKTLALSLQNIPRELEEKIKTSLPDRLTARLEEIITQVQGIPAEDIQNAQTEVVQLCRKLESEEKIEPLAKIIELKESTPQKNIFSNGKNDSASDETTNQDEENTNKP